MMFTFILIANFGLFLGGIAIVVIADYNLSAANHFNEELVLGLNVQHHTFVSNKG